MDNLYIVRRKCYVPIYMHDIYYLLYIYFWMLCIHENLFYIISYLYTTCFFLFDQVIQVLECWIYYYCHFHSIFESEQVKWTIWRIVLSPSICVYSKYFGCVSVSKRKYLNLQQIYKINERKILHFVFRTHFAIYFVVIPGIFWLTKNCTCVCVCCVHSTIVIYFIHLFIKFSFFFAWVFVVLLHQQQSAEAAEAAVAVAHTCSLLLVDMVLHINHVYRVE